MTETAGTYQTHHNHPRTIVRLVPVRGQSPKAYKLTPIEFYTAASLDKCTLDESTFIATRTRLPCHILETLLRLHRRDRRCPLDRCAQRMNLIDCSGYWTMRSVNSSSLKTWEKNLPKTVKEIYQKILKEKKQLEANLKRLQT